MVLSKVSKLLKLERALEDRFLKNNIVFFGGSMMIAFLNYLYHPVLSRLMSIEDFGEVQALISLSMQLIIMLSVFGIIAVNIVSNGETNKERLAVLKKVERTALYLGLAIFSLILVFRNQFQVLLNFQSFYPFISLAIILLISVPLTFKNAYLQGTHDFKAVSVSGILSSLGKLVFGVGLVYFGLRSFGAITGLVVAQIVSLGYATYKTKGLLNLQPITLNSKASNLLKKELKYGFLVFVVFLSVTILFTSDVVLVKHWFPAKEAGLYSGIASIARIIFFVTGSVSVVMLPSIKIDVDKGKNYRLFFRSLLIVLVIGGSTLGLFYLAPQLVIRVLIGEKYISYAGLLPLLSFQLFLVSIINLFFYYYLALRKYLVSLVALVGVLSAFAFSYFNHNSIEAIIRNFIYSSTLALILIMAWFCYNYYKNKLIKVPI